MEKHIKPCPKTYSFNKRRRVQFATVGESMTKQEFGKESDINTIIDRWTKTGLLSSVNTGTPFYGDVSEVPDFRGSLEIVRRTEQAFQELPPALRERFENDPQKLIDFVTDPKNQEEAAKLGLIKKGGTPASAGKETPLESKPGAPQAPENAPKP